jgi:hypothetical protein
MSSAYEYLKFRKKLLEEAEEEKKKKSLSLQILSDEIAPVKETKEDEAWNPLVSGNNTFVGVDTIAPLPKTSEFLKLHELYGMGENPVDVGTLNEIERSTDKAREDYKTQLNEYYKKLAEEKKKAEEEEDNRTWFQKGALEDGVNLKNVLKAYFGTGQDLSENLMAGAISPIEALIDTGAMAVGGIGSLFSRDFGDDVRDWIAKDIINEKDVAKYLLMGQNPLGAVTNKVLGTDTNTDSFLGEKSDELAQSGGQLAITAALQMVGVPWYVTSGVTSFGGEIEGAFKNDASYGEAAFSGLVTAGAEILTEKLFGGSGLGEKGLINLEPLTKGITNRALKALADWGVDMAAEGSEEVMSQFMSTLGQQLSYEREEDWVDLLSDRDAMDDYISQVADSLFGEEARSAYKDAFIGGAALSSVMNTSKAFRSNKTGRDYRTGLTENEQKVFEKEYSNRLEEAKKNNEKLTDEKKRKIYDQVMEDLKEGGISIDTIESAIGGDTYKSYMDTMNGKLALEDDKRVLQEEAAKIEKIEVEKRSEEQKSRLTELRSKILDINRRSSLPQYNQSKYDLKNQLSEDVQKMLVRQNGKNVQTDDYLLASYGEKSKRGQKYEADLTKYSDKQQEIVKKAIESGFLNNTRKTHALVDMIAKIHEDKGVDFDFVNNKKLQGSSYAVNGKTVNGYYDAKLKKIGINIDSAKYLNAVVGHEVTHVFEGTEIYNELKAAAFEYAKSKGEYESRRADLANHYEPEDIDSELVADLVGDYLFSDPDFVKNLSTNHRNVFQKIYDEIKYLLKVATAGSKEARQLEKVKHEFEKVYRESAKSDAKTDAKTKHSLGYHAGDLGKSEGYHMQGGSRDTGHFGTGTYFVGNEAEINDSTYGKRPHHAVEFDNYNLYKVRDDKVGYKLHENLHDLDRGVSQEFLDAAIADKYAVSDLRREAFRLAEQYDTKVMDDELGFEISTDYIGASIRALSEVAEENGVEIKNYDEWLAEQGGDVPTKGDSDYEYYKRDYYDYLKDLLESVDEKRNEGYGKFRDSYFDLWLKFGKDKVNRALQAVVDHQSAMEEGGYAVQQGADSNATVFMKALGYEGIDVRGTGLDNTKYGSVIYDLKGEDLAKKKEIGTAKYSLSEAKIPTRQELESKPPMKVVDISAPQTQGTFAERRKQILNNADEVISRPYLNHDTQTMIFLTKKSYTHAFNNLGDLQLNAAEHLPELIENAVLTHAEKATHGDSHADGVYTFFSAVRYGKVHPVKLKVKEYNYSGQELPKNIKEYFESSPHGYASSYDTVVLEVEEIEKSPTGSVKDMDQIDPFLDPDGLSDISIADLLNLVKGGAEKYIPKFSLAEKDTYVPASDTIKYNLEAVESHKNNLNKQYKLESSVELPELLNRYDKIVDIWERLGGELDSKFLNEWNAKKGKDRSFSVFKAQAGYKYNVELSSMCKKGVPLFEAIDTIVKKEVMNELNTDVLGKAEKEILYDILKQHDFEIPCAICYVEQARQREGVIINDFLNGKDESGKLGWNRVLSDVQAEMAKNGVNYTFRNVDRSIATDGYDPIDEAMDETTQEAFYSALQKMANEEIAKYNAETKEKKLKRAIRPKLKSTTPAAVKECFKGTLPANLKIFKTLFTEPSSRFTIDRDLLYSSMTTQNLASYHNGLYSLFNSQGGVSGYKTKQGTVVYWGDILNKKWDSSKLRNEGGVRNQSNSDFQMYTLLDQAQMYTDFTAKGYYLQAYTKVLSELKLFGLSRGKINASLIPAVKVYRNADGSVDVQRTMENAGLDEDGELLFDDIEGINHAEAFMLIADPEYSKNIGGICIGYSDNHISKLLDDPRVQLIIGFHDKTNDPNKRYRGARYAKNYNGLNEAVNQDGETVHIGFNTYIKKAEKMFKYDSKTESFSGTTTYNGMPYTANDIPRLAADIYLSDCYKKGYTPAYNDFKGHDNYYKLLADFSLYDSNGQYAPHRKVAYDMPSQVPYLDENGAKQYMDSEKYIKQELAKELKVRDAISEAMSDRSEDGIIPQFIKRVNEQNAQNSLSMEGEAPVRYGNMAISGDDVRLEGTVAEEFSAPVREDISTTENATPTISKTEQVEDIAPTYDYDAERFASLDDKDAPPVADQPIQTVEERLAAKLENTRTELATNRRLREQSNADYDQEIARLQAEYDAKKKKDTRVANDILRRIERLRRMKGNIDADYAKRISDLEQKIAKMNSPEYKTAAQRMEKQDEYSSQMKELVGDTSTWTDKKMGLSYKINTLRRNLRDVVRDENGKRDIAKADAIYDELQGKYNQHEASLNRESNKLKKPYADMKITKAEDEYIQMLGELRHNPDTTLTEDVVKEFYEKHKDKINEAKVDKAIEMARKTYDGLLERVNEVLREQGMKEIPYRQGYFPHFTDEKQGFLAKLFNWKTQNNDIPTDIAGLTENFNPNRSWQSFNKRRKGDTTDYSFTRGLDTYVHGALDWIYHIEDIQKRRALENYIRYTHSEKGVQDKIDAIRNNESYDADEMQEQIDLVYKEAGNPLNNFVTDLRAGTNRLANKKSSLDRSMEEMTNRKIYSTMTNLSNRVSANMVGGSISAALTNFIPITQSWGEVSPKSSLRAMKDTIKSTIRNDGIVDKSNFLTNRLKKEENLYKTTWDKIGDKIGFLMDGIDSFTSQTVWRSKYLENIGKGMSESEAIKNADQFAENVIGGRSRGNNPTVFDSKNPLVKALTAFQLEVNNQYGYMFKDMPQDVGSESKKKLVKGYVTMFVGAYAYNALYSSLTGRNAAFDPIDIVKDLLEDLGWIGDDEEEEPTDAFMNLAENIFEEVPFVGGLLGGGRIPISSALPYGDGVIETLSGTLQDFSDKDWNNLTKEWLKPLYYLAMPMGGGQLKKTIEGLSMFSNEHPIAGSYTADGKLRFPVDDTLGSKVQAGLFGQWSSKNAQDYLDKGRQPLSVKQTQEFIDLEMPIQEYWAYKDGLKELDTLAEKADYINSLDLQTWQKNIMINNLTDRKEDIDMTDYDNYASFDEFDYASKNPEKHLVSKAVTDDFEAYQTYTKALSDITSDKDANGKTITNSRKTKVVNYLNSLDIEYGAKLILFKSEYNSDHTYNYEIIEYLNSRDDISYSEMETILKELGFIVDAKGNIYW